MLCYWYFICDFRKFDGNRDRQTEKIAIAGDYWAAKEAEINITICLPPTANDEEREHRCDEGFVNN